MKMPLRGFAVLVGLLIASPAAAAQPACAAPENHQFDFWLGSWEVTGAKGKIAGTNDITLEMGGCVLHEHWKGAGGSIGESFNIFDAPAKKWHQSWVDNSGTLVVMDGGIVDGKMVLEGPGYTPKGDPATNRITWEKLPDGRVRQLWTVSTDGGKSWTTAFDGVYAKK